MVISRWTDELLIGQCEQNINQGCWCLGFDIKRLFLSNLQLSQRAFLYLNSSSAHVVLNRYWAHILIKVTGKIKLVHEIDLVCDHL